jgi:putative peptidoglycan lipid II flippase
MSLTKRVFTVSGWTLVSRVLGLLRDRLWAGSLGGSLTLDCFLMAFALPNLLRNLFGEGALAAAFVPRYVQARDRDPGEAERFAGTVLTRLALLLSAVSALGMLAAGALYWYGGLQGRGWERPTLVALLSIPQIPYLLFICVAATMSGVLNGRRRFAAAAAAPVVLNLVLISTAGLGAERESLLLPYAVLLAGILQVVLLAVAMLRSGGIPPLQHRSTPAERELRGALAPTLVASGIYQLNAYLDTVIAMVFVLGDGPVSYLYFGNRLLQFPMALIGHGVATAAYPELSSSASEGWAATGKGLREACRLLSFWLLPAAVGLLVTAEPVVRTIYQSGRFNEEAIARTVLVTEMLSLALVPIALAKLLMRAFHARLDQRTPMRISLSMVALNLALNLVLVQTSLREAGLALATALSSFAGCAAYLVTLQRRGAGWVIAPGDLLRPATAALLMAAGVAGLLRWWPQPQGHGSGMAALRLASAVALGGALYLPIAGTAWLRRRAGGASAPPSAAAGDRNAAP